VTDEVGVADGNQSARGTLFPKVEYSTTSVPPFVAKPSRAENLRNAT